MTKLERDASLSEEFVRVSSPSSLMLLHGMSFFTWFSFYYYFFILSFLYLCFFFNFNFIFLDFILSSFFPPFFFPLNKLFQLHVLKMDSCSP